METRWTFDPDQFVYACLQLPVPLLCLWHLNQQKRKAREVEKLDDDAPVLLPIYMWLINFEIIYVITKFLLYGFIYRDIDFSDRSGTVLVAETILHAFLFMVLADGMSVFMLVLLFSFQIAPSAGKYALFSSLREAFLHALLYTLLGVVCMSALSRDYPFAYHVGVAILPCTVLVFLVNSLVYMYRRKSPRWKFWLYCSIWTTTFLWLAYFVMCLLKLFEGPTSVMTAIRYVIGFFYAFVLPILYYRALIDDSRYWRNLEKYLLPTETFNLNSRLLDHDGLSCVSLSTEKGHLDDTLLNFKVPLIDFMHLESATSMLGRGGYAVVWKAMYRGEPVAVKELHGERISVRHIKAFFREAVLSTKLEHENILKFYGACVQPPEFLMIFEWCNQGDLGHYLTEKRKFLTQDLRLNLATQATKALSIFHSKGLVHRDLKPTNYLVHETETKTIVKLADFGSCRSKHDKMPLFEGISPLYAPPEIRQLIPWLLKNRDVADTRGLMIMYGQEVDIYSLGWVLWAIFNPKDYKQILRMNSKRILNDEWEPEMSELEWGPQFKHIIQKCWMIEPDERPSVDVLHEILQEMENNDFSDHRIISISSPKAKDKPTSGKPAEGYVNIASKAFEKEIKSFSQSVNKLQRVFAKKSSITTEDLLGYAERENLMALDEIMCSSARELITAIRSSTDLPCFLCRMILQFGRLPESSVHNYVIEHATAAFTHNIKYKQDEIVGKVSRILQLQPAGACKEDSRRLTQKERLVNRHNAKTFQKMAKELDCMILLLNDVNSGFLGGFNKKLTENNKKSILTTYNFDGKGDLFVMATAVFPYVNSKENTYGSFSVHTRIDFDNDLQKTSTTEQLLFIYDDFGHMHGQRSLSDPLL